LVYKLFIKNNSTIFHSQMIIKNIKMNYKTVESTVSNVNIVKD